MKHNEDSPINLEASTVDGFFDEWSRFTQEQIEDMLKAEGLHSIRFSDSAPFWCVSAIKK